MINNRTFHQKNISTLPNPLCLRGKILITLIIFLLLLNNPLHAANELDATDTATTNTESEIDNVKDKPASFTDYFSFKGEFKTLYLQQPVSNYSASNTKKLLVSDIKRIRLSPEFSYNDSIILHADYDNEIISGNYLKSPEFNSAWRQSHYNEYAKLEWEPYYTEDIYYRTKLHRLYAKLTIDKTTITVGRQQLRFGSGRLWNPLDVLNPISPTNIEGAGEQSGTDAIRLEFFPNDKSELSLVYDFKRIDNRLWSFDFDKANLLLRGKSTFGETEIAALTGRLSKRTLAGTDISTILFDGMLRGSLIYSRPDDGDFFFQGGAGYEYTLKFGLYILAEYFYNQSGYNHRAELKNAILSSQVNGIDKTNYYLLANQFLTANQHYAGVALGYDIMELLRGELFMIYDFQGRGLLVMPSLKYSPLENLDISLGVLSSYVFDNGGQISDFEAYHKKIMVYGSLGWYF